MLSSQTAVPGQLSGAEDKIRALLWDAGLLASDGDGCQGRRTDIAKDVQKPRVASGPEQWAIPGIKPFRPIPANPSQEPLI